MTKAAVDQGPLHSMPRDLQNALRGNSKAKAIWDTLTPLARNEWICWLTIVKKPETRKDHLRRLQEDLLAGERRPCCWPGCPHRRPKAAKWFGKGKPR